MLKDTINQRVISEPHRSKLDYIGSENSYTDISHDEENIENYELIDELSNKDTEDVEDSEERKIIFKTLMKMYNQNNVIRYTLANIFSIDKNK